MVGVGRDRARIEGGGDGGVKDDVGEGKMVRCCKDRFGERGRGLLHLLSS